MRDGTSAMYLYDWQSTTSRDVVRLFVPNKCMLILSSCQLTWVSTRATESVRKMADYDSRNFNKFDSDFGLTNILVFLYVKIMRECKKKKAKISLFGY